jgi:glycosyltransferase involved in cell wall biosynthesis
MTILLEVLRNIQFLGSGAREQTSAAIHKARFLVFSTAWYENLPVALAESFACSTPAIANRMGTRKEIVSDGRTDFFAGRS